MLKCLNTLKTRKNDTTTYTYKHTNKTFIQLPFGRRNNLLHY